MSVTHLKGNSAESVRTLPLFSNTHTNQHPGEKNRSRPGISRSRGKQYMQDSALPPSTAKALQAGFLRLMEQIPASRSPAALSLSNIVCGFGSAAHKSLGEPGPAGKLQESEGTPGKSSEGLFFGARVGRAGSQGYPGGGSSERRRPRLGHSFQEKLATLPGGSRRLPAYSEPPGLGPQRGGFTIAHLRGAGKSTF